MARLGWATVLSLSLLVASTPVPELPVLLAGSMSKNRAFLRYSLDGQFAKNLTKSLNIELGALGDRQLFDEAFETAARKLNAGKPDRVTSAETLAMSLSGNTAHGDLFETLSARAANGAYTRLHNPGVDYQYYDGVNRRMVFAQAKATKSASTSVHDALLDSLEFVGKDPEIRLGQITRNRTLFEAVIPADQFDELVREGTISATGKPNEKLVEKVLRSGSKLSLDTGEKATRIRAALPEGKTIVASARVRPGPVSYAALLERTVKAQATLGRFSRVLSATLQSPIFRTAGKVAGGVGTAVSAPIMFAQLDNLEARRTAGIVSDENLDKETFAIFGTAGLSAGVGIALLMFTPAGWIGVGVVGVGAVACWLVDDGCFQKLYEKVIQTDESKRAFNELRSLRGQRAAQLSGFTVSPDWIVNVDERGSYDLAWKNAGSPPPDLPSTIKERAFEAVDTRMWVDNQPTDDDILRFKLGPAASVQQ